MSEQKDFLKNVTTIFENAEKQARNVYNAVNETYNSMSNIEGDAQKENNLKELADSIQDIDDQLFMFKECVMDLNRICTDSLKNIDSKLSQISQSLNKPITNIESSINRLEESIKKSERVGDVLQNIEDEQRAQTKKMDEFINLSSTKINNMEKALRQTEETLRLLLANNLLNAFDKSIDKSNKEGVGSADDKITKTLPPDSITDDKKKTEEQFSPEELYEKGIEARDNKDYKTAFEYFNQAHKKGFIRATVEIGNMYRDGDYLSQNYSKAFELYNFAAMKDDTSAMIQLFFAYKDGNGVQQDLELGKKWLERAANIGNGLAMAYLTSLYCGNFGYDLHYDKAKKWYEKMRTVSDLNYYIKGDVISQLGDFCRNNHNYVEALNYYKESAAYDNADAMCWLGNFYDNGWGAKKNDLLAKEWYEKAADGGDVAAMYNLGCMYRKGRPNITQNYKESRKWYKKAAKLGDDLSMLSLGYMYDVGEGIKSDKNKAVEWYNQAVAAGNTTAMCNLAYMYENGDGIYKDYKKAMQLYQKAAENGDANAMYALGNAYYNGEIIRKDNVKARYWYEKAYAAGNNDAQMALRNMGYNDYELVKIKVYGIIQEQLGLEYDEIQMESEFINDLGADSLDIVELIMAFEEEFNIEIPDEVAENIRTVKDVVNYIYNNL